MMKKITALILLLLAAALICASCAGREPKEDRIVNFKVYNHTGEIISEMKVTSSGSDGPSSLTVHPGTEGSPDSNYLINSFSDNAAIHHNAKFSYKTAGGFTMEVDLPLDGDKIITLLPQAEGGIRIEPAAGRE